MTGEQPPFNLFVARHGMKGYDVDVTTFIAKALDAQVEISIMHLKNIKLT